MGVLRLLRSSHLDNLESLDLSCNDISWDAAETWAACTEVLPSLTALELSGCPGLGDRGVAALASWPGLARLKTLGLANCNFGDAGAIALARSPYAKGLRYINLSSNPIRTAGRQALAEAPLPPRMRLPKEYRHYFFMPNRPAARAALHATIAKVCDSGVN
jgi:hypothetical protein